MAKQTFVLLKDEEKKHSVKYHNDALGTQYVPKEVLRTEGQKGYPNQITVTMEW